DKSGEYLGRKTPTPQSLASYSQMLLQNLRQHGLAGGMARSWRQNQYRLESHRLSPLFESVAQGPIPFEEIRKVFSSHEVILNFSNVWADGRPGSRLIAHVRLRDFEAPMCRTCYLTEYTDELAEFYELEKEIVTYRSPEELVNKTRYYLAHAEEAERIREAGYQRALRDHTWAQRFRQLFSTAGLSN
ncbi:MAG: glycosyltransferase family protein, partial [Pyrinomonadaceae bacterium]